MADEKRNYCLIAETYAKEAIADRKRATHGKYIQKAAKRFLDDLNRAKKKSCKFTFDPWYAMDACDFIEKLPHVEGTWEPPEIVLNPAQVFFVVQLFGFRNRKNPEKRRFSSALYATARKAAKSTLAAGIMLYCFCCEYEPGAQFISAATTYDQASIIWKIAKAMVDRTPELREEFAVETFAKTIARYQTAANFKALHAKASTQDGLNPSHVALDEIHAHKTADLLNVLTSAAGARGNPLWLYTTTEGYTNPGPWGDLKRFGKNLLDGLFGTAADHFLIIYFAIDDEDDEFDESKWIKANPLISENPHLLEAIRKEAIEAKQMPSKMGEFRIKRLNRPAASSDGWVDLPRWQKCGGAVDLEALRDVPCYGGLDLASTMDLCSFRLVWLLDDVIYTHGWRWIPQNAVAHRTERGTVPYAAWVEQGLIIQTEGDRTDYRVIEEKIKDVCDSFNIQLIAYDRWNATDLINRLVDAEIPLIEFVQGPKSYHPAMQALELAYIGGDLAHGGDQVLNWCAANIVARRDVNLNMAPDKKNSADKIDDMTALLMAVGVSLNAEEKPKEYQLFFV